ncbi:MAG: N-6 DNA methylase [Bacilli bacterium]|nr:N-6 DNA methylase [Bacilli bacterium]
MKKTSETVTENIFRDYHSATAFIEKSAIPDSLGFVSKNGTSFKGYPDFYKEEEDFVIIVEAKATKQNDAVLEVKHYMLKNNISKDIVGIALSGQSKDKLKIEYFLKINSKNDITKLNADSLLTLRNINKLFWKSRYGDSITDEALTSTLNSLNKTFHKDSKVKDTERSLFFSGLMIALKDSNFRNTYNHIEAPSQDEVKAKKTTLLEAHYLNEAIIKAIETQLEYKINSLSKKISWKDRFSFIKTIDFSINEYKAIINKIENNIFKPFQNDEKRDILGKAYKIFLKKAGKIDNKNIIITPDHIKSLMVELARLNINDVVLDTCTGTGGFLMESMEVMIDLANNDDKRIEHIKEHQLIGFEIDSVLFALACSNMFLHGDGRTNMIYRSSLVNDETENIVGNKKADILEYIRSLKPTKCIINPPYEHNNSIRFTKQALDYLEPNGKLIIIMPTPTLKRNQNGLTEEILKFAKLDFVIKMPNKLFSEQKRTVNTSIFGFTKTPHNVNDDVVFYNLEDDGFASIQHKGRVDKFNKWGSIRENLVDAVINSKEIDGVCEKRKIFKDRVLNSVGIPNRSEKARMVKILELFDIENGSLASEKSEEGDYDFITGSEEWKKHSEYSHDTEALVYVTAAAGSLGRSHYVNGKFIASNLSLILTPKKKGKYPLNIRFYNTYFNYMRKKIVSDLADGTSKLTINNNDFKDYYVDYINLDEQEKFVSNYIIDYEKKKKKLKESIIKAEEKIEINMASML